MKRRAICIIGCAAALGAAGCGDETSTDQRGEDEVVEQQLYQPVATKDCIDDELGESVANSGVISQPAGSGGKEIAESDYLWPASQYRSDEAIEILAVRPSQQAASKYKIVQSGAPIGDTGDGVYGGQQKKQGRPTRQTVPAFVYFYPSASRANEVKEAYDKATRANPNLPDLGVNREECADCYAPAARKSVVDGNVLITYAHRRVPVAYERLVRSCLKDSRTD